MITPLLASVLASQPNLIASEVVWTDGFVYAKRYNFSSETAHILREYMRAENASFAVFDLLAGLDSVVIAASVQHFSKVL